ncbi:MAG: ABC transporter permease [Candidatus Hydrogenedentota bacterium]|nr:MAG: ABC transporter permease [Candidatus Hydrogenedentota bacterium]
MKLGDTLRLSGAALVAHRTRSSLTVLGIVIGIAAVVMLTSIGEGLRRYIVSQFTQFGTTILAVTPGSTKTTGLPGALGGTVNKLTIDDAMALKRIRGVVDVVPIAFGTARVEAARRGRSVFIYGVTTSAPRVWKFNVRTGRFLPPLDPHRRAPVVVLGPRLKKEIFGKESPLGEHVRIGGRRFRVIGVMEPKGRFLGMDIDDAAYVPVADAMALFRRAELLEIDVLFSEHRSAEAVAARVTDVLKERHRGEEDFTVTTQAAMLETIGDILSVINFTVAAIGGISIFVGAIGILTMMWIAVNERTAEIGLAKAMGATSGQIFGLFLSEAVLLSAGGGLGGTAFGLGCAAVLHWTFPGLTLAIAPAYLVAALAVSLAVGILSGVLPARRAARLDPAVALAEE